MKEAAARGSEETGYKAGRLEMLYDSYEATGIARYRTYTYVATGLTAGKADKDPDELIRTIEMPLKDAVNFVKKAKNTDTKTIASILLYASKSTEKR